MNLHDARTDYPWLTAFASRPSGGDPVLIERRREATAALDEITVLRTQVAAFDLMARHSLRNSGWLKFVEAGADDREASGQEDQGAASAPSSVTSPASTLMLPQPCPGYSGPTDLAPCDECGWPLTAHGPHGTFRNQETSS